MKKHTNKKKFKEKENKNQNIKQNKGNMMLSEWFYMNPDNISVSDIKEALKDDKDVTLELWNEAGVIEITLSDGQTMDVESAQVEFKDEYSNEFLQRNQIQSLFYVTIGRGSGAEVTTAMKQIVRQLGGFFCGDTDNFEPVVKCITK